MEWNKIFNAALYPTIAMLLLQLLSFGSLLINSPYLLPLGSALTFLPTLIYAYAGYSAVKDRKSTLEEAVATGVLINAINTFATIVLTVQTAGLEESSAGFYESSFFTVSTIAALVVGLVFGSFWAGLCAGVGAAIARKPVEDTQQQKKPETKTTYWVGLAVIILIVVIGFLFVLFYLGPVDHPVPSQCTFPAGFTCISYKLYTQTGKLHLDAGQGIGKTIRVTGVACTQNASPNFTTNNFISYGDNNSLEWSSGSSKTIATTDDEQKPWLSISCTDANGNLPSDTGIGTIYYGRIYINYTELETNLTRIVVGTLSAKYEA
jgi:hypothetical protein